MTTTKIARFIRELDRSGADHVRAFLFKVTPAMEWIDNVTYRKGKLLHDPRFGFPHRMKRGLKDLMAAKSNPIYSYSYIRRSTAFVVSSASDLKTMMARGNRRMREDAKERLRYLEVIEPNGDQERQELEKKIAYEETIIRLFEEKEDNRFEVETFLFPAHKSGETKHGGEMEGSQHGTLDPTKPFRDLGYKVIGMPREPLQMKVEVENGH